MKKILLITKDAVSKDYLPIYGNKYWKTPNMNALASKGTLYNRHYTVAASTAMAFYSMITGENCYETKCRDYGDERPFYGETLFEKFKSHGMKSYLIWDKSYSTFAEQHLKIIDGKANIIDLNIIPSIPSHQQGVFDDLTFDDNATNKAMQEIYNCFESLSKIKEDAFIWIHLPHVLAGRNSYASDIDLFDQVVGYGRELFGDNSIFVSADHGNMDGKNGKFGYGFDLDEPAICIPLISPRINGMSEINYVTSNLHMYELLNMIPVNEESVIVDTAYFCQPKRKLAIIQKNYKLVYDKRKRHFELYDLKWDPNEKYNLYYPEFYDVDRLSWYSLNQRFYYPYWEEAFLAKQRLESTYKSIWRQGSLIIEMRNLVKFKLKYLYLSITKKKRAKNIKNIGK